MRVANPWLHVEAKLDYSLWLEQECSDLGHYAMLTISRGPAHLELSFSPSLNLVSIVRRFVADFCMQLIADADVASQVGLATHELLENSARYSLDRRSTIRIQVEGQPDASVVTIETKNRAEQEHLAALRSLVDEIASAVDPFQHYQVLMERNMKRTDGSGLGLGRIRAESDMDLAYVFEDDLVTLRARARYPQRGAT